MAVFDFCLEGCKGDEHMASLEWLNALHPNMSGTLEANLSFVQTSTTEANRGLAGNTFHKWSVQGSNLSSSLHGGTLDPQNERTPSTHFALGNGLQFYALHRIWQR